MAESDTLGVCPACETPLTSTDILIEYETATGQPDCYAECPTCYSVITPRDTDDRDWAESQ